MQSDETRISEDRREALRYALAIGSGAALTSALAATPASAQAAADNTLDRIRADKTLRIAVLPGELPYFNKDLATGTWSGFSIDMANDIAKLLDVKLDYTRGIGQMREWFVKGIGLAGVTPEDVPVDLNI